MFVVFLFFLMLTLTSCGKGKEDQPTVEPSGSLATEETLMVSDLFPTSSVLIPSGSAGQDTLLSLVETDSEPVQVSSLEEDDSLPHIVWVLTNEDTRKRIKQFISQKGIPCHIDFISAPSIRGEDYKEWLSEQKNENNAPDILPAGYGKNGEAGPVTFVEEEFLPLDSYWDTEEGRILRESYGEVEWAQAAVNGCIYNTPIRSFSSDTMSFVKDTGSYIYLNNRYKEYFEGLSDVSYYSLKKSLEQISDLKPVIAIGTLDENVLLAFLGGYNPFYVGYYDPHTKRVSSLMEEEELKEYLTDFYQDIKNGVLMYVDHENADIYSEHVLAYLPLHREDPPEGFTEVLLAPNLFCTYISPGYGILAGSENADLAFQVLSACYSDPAMASLLASGYENAESWMEVTEYLNTMETSELTGFIPRLSDEQKQTVSAYVNDIYDLMLRMFQDQGEERTLNPNYLSYVERFFANPHDYGDVFDELNAQLDEWFSGNHS